MPRQRSPITDLRRTIDCLPLRTREAMLEGIRTNEIVVGAYTMRDGGICPMLAAHRGGGRTDHISFAHAWDRFSGAKRARRATARELRILETQLIASIASDAPLTDLGDAIREHQASARDRREREAQETGFGWIRARRLNRDAGRVLARVERETAGVA